MPIFIWRFSRKQEHHAILSKLQKKNRGKRTTSQHSSRLAFARSKRANVFAAQKQCFCLELLSAPNCLFALRSKRKGRSSRKKRKAKQRVNSQNKILTELAQVGSLLPNSAKLANIWKSTSKLQISLRSYLHTTIFAQLPLRC